MEINDRFIKHLSEVGPRGAYGAAMVELCKARDDVVVVSADLSVTNNLTEFVSIFPEKHINVGIAEQNMIGISAGMSMNGKIVFANSMATFASLRCTEQIRTSSAYMGNNVKIVGSEAGVRFGTLGVTHLALEDIGTLRSIPCITILSPADSLEIFKSMFAAADYPGTVYIRLTGEGDNPIVYDKDYEFEIGKAITLREGKDVTIIATGAVVAQSLKAAAELEGKGISTRVIDMHTIKPLDNDVVLKAARETKLVVTVEEHNILGGLGAAVAEVLAEVGNTAPQLRLGLPDSYPPIETYNDLLELFGLTGPRIAKTIQGRVK